MNKICFKQDGIRLHILVLNSAKTKWYWYVVNPSNEIAYSHMYFNSDEPWPDVILNAGFCKYEDMNIRYYTDQKRIVTGEVVGYKNMEFPMWLRRKLRVTAKCHPEDTFDFNVGRKIVKERMGFDPDAGDKVDFNPDVPDKETTILLLKHFFLANELHSTWKQKNKAYGDSFSKSVETYGLTAALTRMSDKWNRIENLIMKSDTNVGDEPLRDSLMDLANYCLMTVMCIEKDKESAS